jgi:two-component system OmpR family sensor kinase
VISIRRTLLLWLSAGLSAGILAAAGMLYFQARGEANEVFDYQMQQLAASLPNQPFSPIAPSHSESFNAEQDVLIQIWDNTGLRIYYSHEHPSLPQRAELGFSEVRARNGTWRVYSTQLGNTVVQVAQPLSARRALAARVAVKTVAPLLLLLPFAGLLIWTAVGTGLAPVGRVAADVKSRGVTALEPISEAGLPEEIRPLTHAINDLLGRLDQSIDAQRNFVADAAHELRTPLTALRLQAQLAARAGSDEERAAAFVDLQRGLNRATRLVEQLLTLARQEPGAFQQARTEVDLAAVLRSVVSELALVADARHIDLGVTQAMPAPVLGSEDALRIMLSNLVDNAIRYTPEGGKVDLATRDEGATISVVVEDSGPGIPEEDTARVFDRFYRVAGSQTKGSGLGLAIVKQIADAHSGRIALENTRPGLRATVTFPRA